MKKMFSTLMILVMITMLFSGCGKKQVATDNKQENGSTTEDSSNALESDAEIVDGKFVETRKITVEIFDRGNDGGSKPEDNFYTNYIKEGMLRDHNVEVTFIPVPRWTEVEQINQLLAAGDAPDICVTYDYPTIKTYADMRGVTDMAPYLEESKDMLPDLWSWLKDDNIYYNQDPENGTIWAIEARLANLARINTFVRKDWLQKLNIPEPTTMEEFEAMLVAFQDNADQLLGSEAKQMIPFAASFDIGWRADHLLQSFIPSDITEKEHYVYGFDDRNFLKPGIKEGVSVLNDWYNRGLIWNDFPLYGSGDTTEDNLIKAGYVGAFMHNWDYPYRDGEDGINNNLVRLVGPEAGYVAIAPFQNDQGKHTKYRGAPIDRKIFFPATNKEPVASLLYLNWITKFENRKFLQIGEEGIAHEVTADGAIKKLSASGDAIMNSQENIDYTITINGLDLGDEELNIKSRALAYIGIDVDTIKQAYEYSIKDNVIIGNYNLGDIATESGMGPALADKRNAILTQSVVTDKSKFDQVFDSGFKDYLNSGGQAIIDERTAAWEKNQK